MDRYGTIKENLLQVAKQNEDVFAIIAIGSSVRDFSKADEYSDLDLVIATKDTEKWLYGNEPDKLGEIKISFVERTIGGGFERRILFDGALDVDLIVCTPEDLEKLIKKGVAQEVMNRGYRVLYDAMNVTQLLEDNIEFSVRRDMMSEKDFRNCVEDFWFHTIWVSKKILRGELWTAKMCIDAYLKDILLKVIESGQMAESQCDVWHNGRFFEKWAGEETVNVLETCFAHYEKEDMIAALFNTANLFSKVAEKMAKACHYTYAMEAEEYAIRILEGYFPGYHRR